MKKIKRAKINFDNKLKNLTNEEKIKIETVRTLAESLMAQYKITHYKFKFGFGWKYKGICHYNSSIILSLNYALNSDLEGIKNTILHEIAHALVCPGNGHRNEWQLKAKELGVHFYKNYRK